MEKGGKRKRRACKVTGPAEAYGKAELPMLKKAIDKRW
jgi:hypothetical protein